MTTLEMTQAGRPHRDPQDGGGDRRGAVRVRRGGPRTRLPHPGARAHAPDRAPRGDRGLDAARDRGPRARPQAGRGDDGPRRRQHRQLAGPGHEGPGRVRVQLRPAGDGEAFLRRLAELDVNRLGFPRRSPPPSSCATSVTRATPRSRRARPARAVARDPRARVARVPVRRRVGRRRAARGGVRRDRRRPQLPAVVEAGLHRRRGRRRAGARQGVAPALQGPAALPPAHALADRGARAAARDRGRGRRRPARARPLDARPTRPAAARTCASTGACTPTARCCGS